MKIKAISKNYHILLEKIQNLYFIVKKPGIMITTTYYTRDLFDIANYQIIRIIISKRAPLKDIIINLGDIIDMEAINDDIS